ncbi:hypothetical protein M1843_05365 [Isoptericola sp. 4D.3]|jgi:hypothetical protein|uniref:Uncharacterized protein n=1 Tax=Isoptericola peretonis TaxID=2918523 RepID=A0ABT0J119_9MICO|nr:hypothetical protein [Isoptericola sp. 4D.3]
MDPNVYDMLFEHRQEELEREVALRRLAQDLRTARRALRDAAEPAPTPRARPVAAAAMHRPRHA